MPMPSLRVYSAMRSFTCSDMENGGKTLVLSPECTPVRSTSSIMPGRNTSVPSQIASTSTSLPTIY